MDQLFACPDCGGPISLRAAACPRCGRTFGKGGAGAGFGVGLALAVGLGALFVAWQWASVGGRPGPNPNPGPAPAAARPAGAGASDRANRQEIFRAYHHAGMDASREAEARFPLGAVAGPDDLRKHQEAYQAVKGRGRREVLARYGIDGARLDAIEREGLEGRWPLDPRP